MSLWVFGDSFSHDIKDINLTGLQYTPLEENWTSIISKELTGSSSHNNFSLIGCANEFIFNQLLNSYQKFQDGDYVLVVLTSKDRRWFFKERPDLANWSNADLSKDISKQEQNAIKKYATHLYCDTSVESIYNAIIMANAFIANFIKNKNVKFLMLPGFHEMPGVTGTLLDASCDEFDCLETKLKFYEKTSDNRWNHFSEVNHKILASKVINYFKDINYNIDLTKDFKSNIITQKDI